MDLNDIFGDMPNRPDHPDMWKLSQILLAQDADIVPGGDQDANEEAYAQRILAAGIDGKVLAYMATQRAYRMVGVATNTDLLDPEKFLKVQMVASAWIDAFVAASAYAKEYMLPQAAAEVAAAAHGFEEWCKEKGYPTNLKGHQRAALIAKYLKETEPGK